MPIQQVRQKGRTEAFGDLLSGLLSGIATGEQLKRTRKLEDRDAAMRIWQLAQRSPFLAATPMYQEAMSRAGLGGLTPGRLPSIDEIIAQTPEGYDATITVDPATGAERVVYSRRDPFERLMQLRLMGLGLENPLLDLGGAAPTPEVSKPVSEPVPSATPLPAPKTPASSLAPAMAQLSEDWLAAEPTTGFTIPSPKPIPFVPPFGGIYASPRATQAAGRRKPVESVTKLPTAKTKSPYPEWPDAFLEDGTWKVIRNGKKYRIEE